MVCLRQPLGCLNGFGTQATGRIVDDALQPKIVGPVVDDAQIAQHILHFCPVKEPGAADDTVRNAVALEGKFQGITLGIGAVQNRIILELFALGLLDDLSGHEVAFCTFVIGFINKDGISFAVGSPQPLALAP